VIGKLAASSCTNLRRNCLSAREIARIRERDLLVQQQDSWSEVKAGKQPPGWAKQDVKKAQKAVNDRSERSPISMRALTAGWTGRRLGNGSVVVGAGHARSKTGTASNSYEMAKEQNITTARIWTSGI